MQWSCSRVPPPAAAPDKADRSAMAMLRSAVGLALRRSPPSRLFATSGLAPRLPPPAAPAAASRFFSNSSRTGSSCTVDKSTEETKEDLYPRRMHSHHSPAKIRIVMKSFNNQNDNLRGLAPYTQKIGLPESRSLYTVLRSPHIDKKSREQFSTHVKKIFVVKKAETHELQKKFFWLKRLRILGAQYEIHISFKTRLDNKIGCSKGGGLLRQ